MRRIFLFISSYIPLYVLMIVKNILERSTDRGRITVTIDQVCHADYFDEINDFAIIVLGILCIVSWVYLKNLVKKQDGSHYYEIEEIEDQTGNVYFNYISVYLLSCLGLSLNSIVDVFVLAFLMFLVGYIYISNHMTYMNPMLQVLGYKIYEGKVKSLSTKESIRSIIVSRKDIIIQEGRKYKGSGKEDFINLVNEE